MGSLIVSYFMCSNLNTTITWNTEDNLAVRMEKSIEYVQVADKINLSFFTF